MRLHAMRWPDCAKVDWEKTLALVPLGSTEQHGRHLPSDTDTRLVTAIAEAVEARQARRLILAPTLWLGHSPHHLSFGATLSAHHTLYTGMLCEIAESFSKMGCKKLLFLNGHGGNRVPALAALQELKDRHTAFQPMLADYWALAARDILNIATSGVTGIGHACELETSLYLYLYPENVAADEIRDAGTGNSPAGDAYQGYMFQGTPLGWVDDFSDITDTGAFGKPTHATREKGVRFFDAIVEGVDRLITAILAQERKA